MDQGPRYPPRRSGYFWKKKVSLRDIGIIAENSGGVAKSREQRSGLVLAIQYQATVNVETVEAVTGEKSFSIRTYGATHQIYQFHGLFETLLEVDLVNLERKVKSASIFSSGRKIHFRDSLKNFLNSELNAQVFDLTTANGQANSKVGSQKNQYLRQFVNEQYIKRANAALNDAVPLLYHQTAIWLNIAAASFVFGLFLLGRFLPLFTGYIWSKVAIIGILTWLIAVAAKKKMLINIKQILGETIFSRFAEKFQTFHRTYLIAVGFSFGIGWYLSLLVARWLISMRPGLEMNFWPIDGWVCWY